MTDQSKASERDEVLFAFHQAFVRPTAGDIIEWTRRYPEFAEDIREHAAIAWDWALAPKKEEQPLDETMAARAYSQALNLIYKHASEDAAEAAAPKRTFQQMQSSAGKETHQIARELGISRAVLSDLFGGRMNPPIRKRLIDGLLGPLRTTREEFMSALDCALHAPLVGHAKSSHLPKITARSCDEILRECEMTSDRKRYWLEED